MSGGGEISNVKFREEVQTGELGIVNIQMMFKISGWDDKSQKENSALRRGKKEGQNHGALQHSANGRQGETHEKQLRKKITRGTRRKPRDCGRVENQRIGVLRSKYLTYVSYCLRFKWGDEDRKRYFFWGGRAKWEMKTENYSLDFGHKQM